LAAGVALTVRYALQFYYSFYRTHSENNDNLLKITEIHLEAMLSEGLSLNAAIFFSVFGIFRHLFPFFLFLFFHFRFSISS